MGAAKELVAKCWVVNDEGEQVPFGPGDTLPEWAAKQITNPAAWGEEEPATGFYATPEPDADADVKPYAKWLKADLEAEVNARNDGRADDDLIEVGGNGTVADLAAALDADDEDQA